MLYGVLLEELVIGHVDSKKMYHGVRWRFNNGQKFFK